MNCKDHQNFYFVIHIYTCDIHMYITICVGIYVLILTLQFITQYIMYKLQMYIIKYHNNVLYCTRFLSILFTKVINLQKIWWVYTYQKFLKSTGHYWTALGIWLSWEDCSWWDFVKVRERCPPSPVPQRTLFPQETIQPVSETAFHHYLTEYVILRENTLFILINFSFLSKVIREICKPSVSTSRD